MVVNDNIIGIRIKLLREERGLTLDQVAHDLRRLYGTKVNKGMISKWESGTVEMKLSYGKLLAEYYGVSLDFIAGLSKERR